MAFQPVPNTAQLCWRFRVFNQPVQCCIYLLKTGGISQEDLDELTAEAMAKYIEDMDTTMPADVDLVEIYSRSLITEEAPQSSDTNGGVPVPGTGVTPVENVGEAYVLGFSAGLTGRSTRGRIYIPGVTASSADDGALTGATITFITAAWIGYVADLELLGWTHVILSRFADGVKRVSGVTYPVQAYSMSSLIGSQRNRRVGANT